MNVSFYKKNWLIRLITIILTSFLLQQNISWAAENPLSLSKTDQIAKKSTLSVSSFITNQDLLIDMLLTSLLKASFEGSDIETTKSEWKKYFDTHYQLKRSVMDDFGYTPAWFNQIVDTIYFVNLAKITVALGVAGKQQYIKLIKKPAGQLVNIEDLEIEERLDLVAQIWPGDMALADIELEEQKEKVVAQNGKVPVRKTTPPYTALESLIEKWQSILDKPLLQYSKHDFSAMLSIATNVIRISPLSRHIDQAKAEVVYRSFGTMLNRTIKKSIRQLKLTRNILKMINVARQIIGTMSVSTIFDPNESKDTRNFNRRMHRKIKQHSRKLNRLLNSLKDSVDDDLFQTLNALLSFKDSFEENQTEINKLEYQIDEFRLDYDERVEMLELKFEELIEISHYVIAYNSALRSLNKIKTMAGYYMKFSLGILKQQRGWWGKTSYILKSMIGNLFGLSGLLRFIYGYTLEVLRSRHRLYPKVGEVVTLGNRIIPYLYPNFDDMKDFQKLSRRKQRRVFVQTLGLNRYIQRLLNFDGRITFEGFWWKLRKFTTRLMGLVPYYYIVQQIIQQTPPGFWQFVLAGASIFIGSIVIFGMAIFQRLSDRIRKFILNHLFKKYGRLSYEGFSNDLLIDEWEETFFDLKKELNGNGPATDVIFIMVEEKQLASVEQYCKKIRGVLCRNDVPIIFIPDNRGTGNTLFEFFEKLKDSNKSANQLIADFDLNPENYPHLVGKTIQDLRIGTLYITPDFEDAEVVGPSSIPADLKETLSRSHLNPLDYKFLNMYKAMRYLKDHDRAGISIFGHNDTYLGPFRRTGDITIMGTYISKRQGWQQGLPLMRTDFLTNLIQTFYQLPAEETDYFSSEKVDTRFYDPLNPQIRQWPYAGPIMISFDDPSRYKTFLSMINEIREYIDTQRSKFPVMLIPDVLIPLTILSQQKNINTYHMSREDGYFAFLEAQKENFSKRKARNFYLDLFDHYSEIYQLYAEEDAFYFHAYEPYIWESDFLQVNDIKTRLSRGEIEQVKHEMRITFQALRREFKRRIIRKDEVIRLIQKAHDLALKIQNDVTQRKIHQRLEAVMTRYIKKVILLKIPSLTSNEQLPVHSLTESSSPTIAFLKTVLKSA